MSPQNNNIYPSRTRGVNIISLRLFPPVRKFSDLPALFLLDGAYVLRITPVFMTFLFSNYSYLSYPFWLYITSSIILNRETISPTINPSLKTTLKILLQIEHNSSIRHHFSHTGALFLLTFTIFHDTYIHVF